MNNKKGFTLIEVIVSVVLVSVVMISLLSSLVQLRKTYSTIHENSDILVYSSSISRVINNDLSKNNGVRSITCAADGKSCDMILGNNSKRKIELLTNSQRDNNYSVEKGTHDNIKTTIKYSNPELDSSEKSLIYIRTLELDKYTNKDGVQTTKGYSFLDLNASKTEYYDGDNEKFIDIYTTLTIRINNGVDDDINSNNVVIYAAGRYDFSHYYGKKYTIYLDPNGEVENYVVKYIDELFGVGFFESESIHDISTNHLRNIPTPTKTGFGFAGYYYKDNVTSTEVLIIDSQGNIVANNRFFKEGIPSANAEDVSKPRVYAKWEKCENGYELKNGVCVPKDCNVVLNPGANAINSYTGYTIKYMQQIPKLTSDQLPYKDGHLFNGYYKSIIQYHDKDGTGKVQNKDYNDENNVCITLNASWQACPKGTFLRAKKDTNCIACVQGSYNATEGSSKCIGCNNGKTNSSSGKDSCDEDCSNNAHVKTWKTNTWNSETNKVNNICIIESCEDGYKLQNNECVRDVRALYYSYRPTTTFEKNEILDTKQKINWDEDFEIHAAFKIPETGKRYLIAGSYNGSSNQELNIEVNASDQLRVYIGGSKTILNVAAGKIKANENVNLVFVWNSTNKELSLTSSGDGLVTNPNIKRTVTMSGSASNTIVAGGNDHRSSSVFNQIYVTTLIYKKYYTYNTTVTLSNPTSTTRAFKNWLNKASGGSAISSVKLSSDTTIYGEWVNETVITDSIRCGGGNVDWTINGNHANFDYDIFLYYTFVRKANNDIYATTSIKGRIIKPGGSGYYDYDDYDVKYKSNWVKGSVTIGDKKRSFNETINPTAGEWWALNNEKVGNGNSIDITCTTDGYVEAIVNGVKVDQNSWDHAGPSASGPYTQSESYTWTVDLK